MDDRNSKNTYPQDCSDETNSDADVTWSPGDGEFNHCCQSKYDDWSHASNREGFNTLQFYLDAFLDLHRDIPPVHTKPFHSGYFTTIVLAGPYIVSCRWVDGSHKETERKILFALDVTRPICYKELVYAYS